MPIFSMTTYMANCDMCEMNSFDEGSFAHRILGEEFEDEGTLIEALYKSGWKVDNNEIICDECLEKHSIPQGTMPAFNTNTTRVGVRSYNHETQRYLLRPAQGTKTEIFDRMTGLSFAFGDKKTATQVLNAIRKKHHDLGKPSQSLVKEIYTKSGDNYLSELIREYGPGK